MTTERKSTKSVATKQKVEWKPASRLNNVEGLDTDNFTYRWVNKDEANLMKKKAEGWEITKKTEGDKAEHVRANNIDTGAPLATDLTDYREMVLMRLPNELAEARKEYYAERNRQQIDALTDSANAKASQIGGSVHQKLTIGDKPTQID